MRRVILESPYAGEVKANVAYAQACLRDCLLRDEAPLASHLLYTQPGVLDDNQPVERQLGIDAGLAWGAGAEATVVYIDRGISEGMRYGIKCAHEVGRPVEYRSLYGVVGAIRLAEARGVRERLSRLFGGFKGRLHEIEGFA